MLYTYSAKTPLFFGKALKGIPWSSKTEANPAKVSDWWSKYLPDPKKEPETV